MITQTELVDVFFDISPLVQCQNRADIYKLYLDQPCVYISLSHNFSVLFQMSMFALDFYHVGINIW